MDLSTTLYAHKTEYRHERINEQIQTHIERFDQTAFGANASERERK